MEVKRAPHLLTFGAREPTGPELKVQQMEAGLKINNLTTCPIESMYFNLT